MNPQKSSTSSTAGVSPGGGGTGSDAPLAKAKDQLAQSAKEAASGIKAAAGGTATRAKEEVERVVSGKREMAANRIGSYSSAFAETASSLEEKDPNLAWFAHRAADKLQDVAEYMRNHDFAAFKHDAEAMARRHPAAFLGGMLFVGLVMGNFVKASRRKLDGPGDHPGMADTAAKNQMQTRAFGDGERTGAGTYESGLIQKPQS